MPATILANFLRENGIVPEKCDLNSILFLLTPAENPAKMDHTVEMLAQFERYVAEDAPLSVVLPTVYRKNEQRYRGYSIRRLCGDARSVRQLRRQTAAKEMFRRDHFPPVVMNPQDANVEFIRDNVELVPIGGRKGASRRKGPCRTRPACCAWCRAKCGAARRSATSALEEGINRLPGFSPELQGSTSRKRSRLEAHLRLYDQAIEKGRFVPALLIYSRGTRYFLR